MRFVDTIVKKRRGKAPFHRGDPGMDQGLCPGADSGLSGQRPADGYCLSGYGCQGNL